MSADTIQRPGGLEASQGPRARGADHAGPLGAASALAPAGAPLKEAVEWLEKYRPFWQGSFDRLDDRIRRNGCRNTITRVFDATRERVWQEWTEPERFAAWFGGAAEVPLSTVSMDVRAGGAWRATMYADPGRREIHWKGEYLEVAEPERLVFTLSDEAGDDRFELITVVLTDLGDGRTEMLFQQRGRLSPEQYEHAKGGWSSFFDRIAEHLAGG